MSCPSCDSHSIMSPESDGMLITVGGKVVLKCADCNHEWLVPKNRDMKVMYKERSNRLPICPECHDTKHVITSPKLVYPPPYICTACKREW